MKEQREEKRGKVQEGGIEREAGFFESPVAHLPELILPEIFPSLFRFCPRILFSTSLSTFPLFHLMEYSRENYATRYFHFSVVSLYFFLAGSCDEIGRIIFFHALSWNILAIARTLLAQ